MTTDHGEDRSAYEQLRGGWRVDDDDDVVEFNRLLDAALAAERRATVERCKAILVNHNYGNDLDRNHPDWRDGETALAHIARHLDAEAER